MRQPLFSWLTFRAWRVVWGCGGQSYWGWYNRIILALRRRFSELRRNDSSIWWFNWILSLRIVIIMIIVNSGRWALSRHHIGNSNGSYMVLMVRKYWAIGYMSATARVLSGCIKRWAWHHVIWRRVGVRGRGNAAPARRADYVNVSRRFWGIHRNRGRSGHGGRGRLLLHRYGYVVYHSGRRIIV